MNQGEWCSVCCTQHDGRRDCPGNLLATGPERHGRRVAVNAGGRTEVYGVLIAECRERWRARVLTYPNMLWSVPGGRGALKFDGDNPQDVELQAMEYIRDHCERRSVQILEEGVALESVPIVPGVTSLESDLVYAPVAGKDHRHLHQLSVRFGDKNSTVPGTTSDLSKNGLFIATDQPLSKGRMIKMLLEIDGFTIPLVGRVIWTTPRKLGSKPAGMGIQLQDPPLMYVRHVRQLNKAEDLS